MAKLLQGKVVSDKMDKTVVVEVERVFKHPVYHKTLKKHKRFKAHNEMTDIKLNDIVIIQETRPLSKEIRFKVIKKI